MKFINETEPGCLSVSTRPSTHRHQQAVNQSSSSSVVGEGAAERVDWVLLSAYRPVACLFCRPWLSKMCLSSTMLRLRTSGHMLAWLISSRMSRLGMSIVRSAGGWVGRPLFAGLGHRISVLAWLFLFFSFQCICQNLGRASDCLECIASKLARPQTVVLHLRPSLASDNDGHVIRMLVSAAQALVYRGWLQHSALPPVSLDSESAGKSLYGMVCAVGVAGAVVTALRIRAPRRWTSRCCWHSSSFRPGAFHS